MFELRIALRYLIPRKKSLSTALVSLISVGVISLVVWLVLVFLSVTSGIERNWLSKLTSLHAPIRLSPTDRYYSSYYYLADSVSAASNFNLKTIGEKAVAPLSDPYVEDSDAQLPFHWPQPEKAANGLLRDPVKEALGVLEDLHVPHQDYEIGGALLRLSLQRSEPSNAGATLSQMSYLLSLMENNPLFSSLILPPSDRDLDVLLERAANDPERLQSIFEHGGIEEVSIGQIPISLFPQDAKLEAYANLTRSSELIIPEKVGTAPSGNGWVRGTLQRKGGAWQWKSPTGEILNHPMPLLQKQLALKAEPTPLGISVNGSLQGVSLAGELQPGDFTVFRAAPKIEFSAAPSSPPPWAISINERCQLPTLSNGAPVLLPKTYRDMGLCLGDTGSLSFSSAGAASSQEQRIAIRVAGFYDPGLFSLGGRCLIVPPSITRTIHSASQTFSPDGTPTNGIFVWNSSFLDAENLKSEIETRLDRAGILPYWKVTTYKDFEFSKELFQQFRSDRTLFILIAGLILFVACCNVISLLILLVNDKKREIAILQAMGAPKRSMATIFGLCGLIMGALSSLIGTMAAIFTLRHLDSIASFLSALQGHAAFQPAFFGKTLPNQLSTEALLFVFIATPLLSLLAGLIPALRACRIKPSSALRQE